VFSLSPLFPARRRDFRNLMPMRDFGVIPFASRLSCSPRRFSRKCRQKIPPLALSPSLFRRPSSTSKISALTQKAKCHILAASRIYPRGWGCIWDSATRSLSGPRSVRPPAWMLAGRFGHTTNARADGTCAAPFEERPVAPGKVSCPKPPWDTAFPGAFFCAHPKPHRRSQTLTPDYSYACATAWHKQCSINWLHQALPHEVGTPLENPQIDEQSWLTPTHPALYDPIPIAEFLPNLRQLPTSVSISGD
jgi:hypothetical protein